MVGIEAHNLEKAYGAQVILHRASFQISHGAKVGLLGRNGEGKTTLLRILAGEENADAGGFRLKGKLGYLPQEAPAGSQLLGEYLGSGGQPTYAIRRVAARIGIPEALLTSSMTCLSEGEKARAALARLLLAEPDILLLDEPTAHLDVGALKWLEDFLAAFVGTVLVVSHDRYFLDRVVDRVLELENGKLTAYSGNYSFYAKQKTALLDRQRREYADYMAEKRRLEDTVRAKMAQARRTGTVRRPRDPFEKRNSRSDFFAAKEKRMAKQAKAMVSRLEKLREKERPHVATAPNLILESDAGAAVPPIIMEAEGLAKGFAKRQLFSDVRFAMERGQRVALIGDNGVGKTTLLRIITGELTPDRGTLRVAPGVRLGYLDQRLRVFDDRRSVLEETMQRSGCPAREVYNILACLLFRGDAVHKKVAVLSRGERVRLAFAGLVLSDCNLLVLDEPTNSLDLPSREAVETALDAYHGGILFVSHDRYFLRRMSTQVWELADETVHCSGVPYSEYRGRPQETNGPDEADCEAELLLLETQLARLAAELTSVAGTEAESALDAEYIDLARKINRLKRRRRRR